MPCDCRDVDETKSWMNEKDTALLSDDYGRDLASVQALQRKHEGLERDLAALEDKVLSSTHTSNKSLTIGFYPCRWQHWVKRHTDYRRLILTAQIRLQPNKLRLWACGRA